MASDVFDSIDSLLSRGLFQEAEAALGEHPDNAELAVLHVKLDLYQDKLPAGHAMQKLIQLMRKAPDQRGAKELYQEASSRAYTDRQSSVSHSHPPPPVGDDDEHE